MQIELTATEAAANTQSTRKTLSDAFLTAMTATNIDDTRFIRDVFMEAFEEYAHSINDACPMRHKELDKMIESASKTMHRELDQIINPAPRYDHEMMK